MTSNRAVQHPSDDPALADVARLARKHFGFCWRHASWRARTGDPGLGAAGVKAAFTEPRPGAAGSESEAHTEHMWVEVGDFDGFVVSGHLLNDPIEMSGPVAGTLVQVPLDDVEDWLYSIHGQVYGGFSVQVMRVAMGRRERRRHDRAWGLDFGEPGVISLMPDDEAHPDSGGEHTLCRQHRHVLAESLAADPALVRASDEDGWTALHREALAGNAALVEVLLDHGADPAARLTGGPAEGATAYDLAVRLDWDHVAAVLEGR